MIEGTIKDYLLSIGFIDAGACPVCGGRAWQYAKGQTLIKVRIDQYGKEYENGTFTIEGKNKDGRRIVFTRGYRTNIDIVLKDLGV